MSYYPENFEHLKELLGLTQNYIAENLGVTTETLSNWKKKDPSLTSLLAVCSFFNERIPELNLSPETLINTDISEMLEGVHLSNPPENLGTRSLESGVNLIVVQPEGLKDFLASKECKIANLTEEEFEILNSFRFSEKFKPGISFYIEAVLSHRDQN